MPLPSSERPLDALIGQYVTGNLSAPLHALVGAHIELTPSGAAFARQLESLHGDELASVAPARIASRDAMLEAIFASSAKPEAPRREGAADPVFAPSLRRYLGVSSSDVKWRTVLPGVKQWTVEDKDGTEATLYWIRAGRAMPSHTHEGQEITLVLRGGFTDVAGHYRRGDVAIADTEVDHKPVADADEDCICFAVTDAPLRLTGPVARLFRGIFRH